MRPNPVRPPNWLQQTGSGPTAQLAGHGLASFRPGLDGVLLHTADTHKGQSGSPVWMEFNDGSRYLVGVHVNAHRVFVATDDASPVRELPITANMAVHLSDDVLRLVRSWMSPATAVQGGSKLHEPTECARRNRHPTTSRSHRPRGWIG